MFAALAPVLGWLSLGGVGVAGMLAIAWFFPPFRRIAIEAAAIFAVATLLYGKGIHDGSAIIQAKWDAAEKAAVARGEKAHDDAVNSVNSNTDGVRGDPADRD